MAKITRSRKLWHIPKRSSVHQTIGLVHVLSLPNFRDKSWSRTKQEQVGSKLGLLGLTRNGKAISGQAVRTLLALPKYLGFVFVDTRTTPPKLVITDVGWDLIKSHSLAKKLSSLKEYQEKDILIKSSNLFELQMSKLQITNPLILSECRDILVFPFRATLKLLLDLDYLDLEEIAYILFKMSRDDELGVIKERIMSFRRLPAERREREIGAYKKTEEGQLTLVKAPTAGYYMSLCCGTGLCKRDRVKVNKQRDDLLPCLRLVDKESVRSVLKKFVNAKAYDFKDNFYLWIEYYSNPERLSPPRNARIKIVDINQELLLVLEKDNHLYEGVVLDPTNNSWDVPMFVDESYDLAVYELKKGDVILKKAIRITHKPQTLRIKVSLARVPRFTLSYFVEGIREIGKGKMFDADYEKRLKILKRVLGIDYFNNYYKGGRLEYLFFELFNHLKPKFNLDEVLWFGKIGKYGICTPAPGGKHGNPDLVIDCGSFLLIIEVTSIKGVRAQWDSAEASSVPDHIIRINNEYQGKKEIIGVFTAPSIHEQLRKNLERHSIAENVRIVATSFEELLDVLNRVTSKKELREALLT